MLDFITIELECLLIILKPTLLYLCTYCTYVSI